MSNNVVITENEHFFKISYLKFSLYGFQRHEVEIQKDGSQIRFLTGDRSEFVDTDLNVLAHLRTMIDRILTEKPNTNEKENSQTHS